MQLINKHPDLLAACWSVHGRRFTSRLRPVASDVGLHAALCVKAAFKLRHEGPAEPWPDGPGFPSGALPYGGDPSLGVGYPSDFTPFKPKGELLLIGKAFPPQKVQHGVFHAGLRVGAAHKVIAVHGPRTWQRRAFGTEPGDPGPPAPVELSFANAWGGPHYAPNPLGKGIETDEMHELDRLSNPVTERSAKAAPACFAPLPAEWAWRRSLLGTFDEAWVEHTWPWMPRDFDPAYFQWAPPEQCIEGYWRGDEKIHLEHLHCRHEHFHSRLPGLRVRAIAEQALANRPADSPRTEIPLVLDTVWIDAEQEQLVLSWRGQFPVSHLKLKDVRRILIFSESLECEPTPEKVWLPWLDGPVEDSPFGAEEDVALEAARAELAAWQEILALEKDRLALVQRSLSASQTAAPDLIPPTSLDDLAAAGRTAVGHHPPPPSSAGLADILPSAHWAKAQSDLRAALPADRLPADLNVVGPAIAEGEATATPAGAQEARARLAEKDQQLSETLSTLNGAPSWRDFWDGEKIDLPTLRATGLENADCREAPFAGLDLSGVACAGASMQGADLSKADLRRADLSGVDLSHARLDGANLSGAICEDADFAQASVVGTLWKGLLAPRCNLAGLNLSHADFSEAKIPSSDLTGCNLSNASFRGTLAAQAIFADAHAEEADFTSATLAGADFSRASAKRARFRGADLTNFRAGEGANFLQASFVEARASGSVWEDSHLEGTNFSGANLDSARFADACACRANFDRASLRGAVFEDADLQEALLTHANLLRAILDRANCQSAKLTHSNLYEASFWGTVLKAARWDGSLIDRTRLDHRQ